MATEVDQSTETARVVREYFEALGRGEGDAPLRWYAPQGTGHLHGVFGPAGREEISAWFVATFDAVPDWRLEVLDLIAEGDRAAVRWRAHGTFAGPGPLQGLQPNGARLDVDGSDFVWVADGRIQRIEAYADNLTFARQLGLVPPEGSPAERGMTGALNARTRAGRRLVGGGAQPIADGVWIVRGGFPAKTMNVFLIRDRHPPGDGRAGGGDGVLCYDAGSAAMSGAVAAAGASLGGITRVVLGHAHPDHRGVAPALGVPVLCHADERADAEGDGGLHYMDTSRLDVLRPAGRLTMPTLLRLWDGGPVRVAGTLADGDRVAGFEVVHLPGHAPGLIALWRETDRLALVSDCFYTLDPQTGRSSRPRVPHEAFSLDREQARVSVRRLAALEPATAWPGHAGALTGDVRGQLERAADTT